MQPLTPNDRSAFLNSTPLSLDLCLQFLF
uniref:Uncharacterized protein n=1 Tax=Rhizophora mucronata TaxID=61149 RepID=A0A2P2Q0E4_RHIMU